MHAADGPTPTVDSLRFYHDKNSGRLGARLTCRLANTEIKVTCTAEYDESKHHWLTSSSRMLWHRQPPTGMLTKDGISGVLRGVLMLLGVTWTRGVESGDFPMTKDQILAARCISRPRMAQAHAPFWPALWENIANRAQHDPELIVEGLHRAEVAAALEQLRDVYSWTWVRAQLTGPQNAPSNRVQCAAPDGVRFPALHLARLAIGDVCKDPALNCLMTLGQSIRQMRGTVAADRLFEQAMDLAEELYLPG